MHEDPVLIDDRSAERVPPLRHLSGEFLPGGAIVRAPLYGPQKSVGTILSACDDPAQRGMEV